MQILGVYECEMTMHLSFLLERERERIPSFWLLITLCFDVIVVHRLRCKIVDNGLGAGCKQEGPNLLNLHRLFLLMIPANLTQIICLLVRVI